ncbi:TPA: DUF4888 domain-containing protein [Staphylococcus aureus]|uniref:DUF4888 domain-containing protein n=1 Tax=Staphylococcus aureus TaxID=1280 RepID=UPI0002423C01|nr:DUF4888 domain-containing protein [Staphylococcus aureus]EHM61188.1 hypothetical protein SA21202_2685 [Staphylococcus aureus subsp. aureus 21202]HBC4337116.1 DUF4888 domain-containing protein [Staphylococcus aureus]HDA2203682.1 DUF4888 domain-containing protein [Staphylococcus aureus]HDA2226626.1 DUF4888 domain-containing protein [Staphylococcus aureus]HDA6869104.1 DUF4888 domain-containing protein [Staphylococcus aureus]
MNKKLLTKTLIASALVLTTVGSGFHSSSNYIGIKNVAKASEITDSELWKNVRDALKDANIIDKTDKETIKVKYKLKNGGESEISGTANLDNLSNTNNSTVSPDSVNTVDITRVNPNGNKLDANDAWKKLTQSLKEKNIVKDGDTVTIHSKDSTDPKISGKVGQDFTDHRNYMLDKKDIDKITIN